MKLLAIALTGLLSTAFAARKVDLQSVIGQSGVVDATDKLLEHIFESPRDYSIALLLTADDDRFGCGFCKPVGKSVTTVARNWVRDHPEGDGLYFVRADIDNCRQAFKKLNLESVPHFYFYPPSDGKLGIHAEHEIIEFHDSGSQVDLIVRLFGQRGFPVRIVKPIPWHKFFKRISFAAAALAACYVFRSKIWRILTMKGLWQAGALVTVLLFVGGHMFNVIRQSPLFVRGNNGQNVYIQPGFSTQFAIETQMIAFVYGVLAFATISLITKVSNVPRAAQVGTALVLAAVILFMYSLLIDMFRRKTGNYPYRLIPIF